MMLDRFYEGYLEDLEYAPDDNIALEIWIDKVWKNEKAKMW